MGDKIIFTIVVIALVAAAYVFILAMLPATNAIISTANASANWSNAQDAQGVMNSFPLWQYLLPGFIGLVALVARWRMA